MESNWSPASEDLLNRMFPVHRACRDGDTDKLSSLLSTGEVNLYEEDDFYGWTPIHWAAYFGKLQCLMYMLENGGSCDAVTERLNQSPSHIAAYGGHSHCLKWLLQCGGTMNRQLACLRRLINTLESMGVKGCNLATTRFSQTAVHLCAFGGHPQSLYWLAQSNCDLNAQDYMGETPIHKAARTGSMECVSLLVSQGANLSLKNYSGNTPSQVAMTSGYADCANYLERAVGIQNQTMGIPATPTTINGNNSVSNGRTSPEGQPSVQNHFISTNTYHSHPYISAIGTSHHPHVPNGLNNNNHDDCDMEMEDGSHDSGVSQSNCFHQEIPNGDILLNQGVSKNTIPLAGKKRGREDTDEETYKRARQDDYVYEERNRFAFSQLPFVNDMSENLSSMDCNHGNISNENVAPSAGFNNNQCIPLTNQTGSGFTVVPESQNDERGHLGEIYQNRQEPFSCVKYRDPPVKYTVENKCKLNGWFVNNGHMVDHVTSHVRSHAAPVSESMVEHYTSVSMQQGYDSMMLSAMILEQHGS